MMSNDLFNAFRKMVQSDWYLRMTYEEATALKDAIAALRLDSARLDWMMKNCIAEDSYPMYESREEIDAAMKEVKA